jgi:hypothetical protein
VETDKGGINATALTESRPQMAKKKSGPKPRPIKERILDNVVVDENGCWRWQKYITSNGYGQIGGSYVTSNYTHRVAYEAWRGPIPVGLHIDHLCRVRDCCNPDHLEAVTPGENVLRGEGFAAKHARATECPNGHPYDSENTYSRPRGSGGRDCKICRRALVAKTSAKRKRIFSAIPVADRPQPSNARKSHCKAGHPYAGSNLYVDPRGNRQCRQCRQAATKRSLAKRKAER